MSTKTFTTFLGVAMLCALLTIRVNAAAPMRPMSDLRQLVEQAVASHASKVVIPPGTYRGGPAAGDSIVLTIHHADNLKIVAKGVLMVCTMRTRAIEFNDCSNTELDGLTIDYDPLTFTQGKVTAVAPDKSWIDVTIDAGYPRMPFSRIDVVDPKTRYRVHGMPFLWGTKAELVQPDVVRVSVKGIGDAAPVGLLASLNDGNEAGGACHGVTLEDCRGGMVLKDVTIYCAPGMGIVEHSGLGGTKLLGVKIMPGPPPIGATEARLLTTSWDGILHTIVRHGPDVEGCTIEDCGDDSWSDQSESLLIVKSDGANMVLAGGTILQPGDHIQRSLSSAPIVIVASRKCLIAEAGLDEATVEKLDSAKQWTVWSVPHESVQVVTLEAASGLPIGTPVYCPDQEGNGFVFRNNYVHNSGRLLIKASHGLIENNTIIDGHNTVIDPEAYAYGIRDIVFRNNKVVGSDNFCNMPWSTQAGAFSATASLDADGKKQFADFDIEGNIFEDVSGVNASLAGIDGLKIRDNRFVRPHYGPMPDSGAEHGIDQTALIYLKDCNNVQIAGNSLTSPGANEKHVLETDSTDTNVVESKNAIAVAGTTQQASN